MEMSVAVREFSEWRVMESRGGASDRGTAETLTREKTTVHGRRVSHASQSQHSPFSLTRRVALTSNTTKQCG